ncbi:hypothetical protein ACFXA4_06330 [Streptomyces sp. NPDC059442]|uniref:hypothetical protein n=1 Tax=Streptomyces sp. NPDC059442 TaxID=3346830 RepID=UPI0036B988BF
MTPHNELRLLPWSGPDGKPCYLSTDTTGGPLSRLADHAESAQLAASTELLEHAREVLVDETSDPEELRLLATDLTCALRDALRVAASRGHRLPETHASGHGGDAGPSLPAAAFG